MPYMCTIQMPMGKPKERIEISMVYVSEVLTRYIETKPSQVRVIVYELPLNRYIIGGVMADEMPEFGKYTPEKET